jgi:hypothetical protein
MIYIPIQHKINKAKQLPRHGQIGGGGNGMNDFTAIAKEIEKQFAAADLAAQRMKSLQEGVTKIIGDTLVQTAQAFSFYEQRNKTLNDSLGITSKKAGDLGTEMDALSESLQVGGVSARKYAINLNSIATGFITAKNMSIGFGKALVTAQAYMIDNLKVSEAAAQGYELYAAGMDRLGIDQLAMQNSIAESIEGATGMQGVQKDLTETIGNLTADLQVQYGRIPGSLELAILKSRALGMSMADLNKTGQNLLNIESSVGDELEYQLLTGKRLIGNETAAANLKGKSLTNEYRMATIQGNANKQAEIMNQILAQEGETLQTNMFARQQMAKMLGTDEATLAKSLQKRKLLQQLGAEDLMRLQGDKFETGLKDLQKEVENDPDRKKIYEQLIEATDTRTSDERIAAAVEKLQTTMAAFTLDDKGQMVRVEQGDEAIKVSEVFQKKFVKEIEESMIEVFSNPGVTTFLEGLTTIGTAGRLFKNGVDSLINYLKTGQFQPQTANDALITFNPQDKFMAIAGTNVDGNASLAQTVQNYSGGSNGGDQTDLTMLANMIVKGMQGVKLEVNTGLGAPSRLNRGRFA